MKTALKSFVRPTVLARRVEEGGQVNYRCGKCTRILTWEDEIPPPDAAGTHQKLPCGKCGTVNRALVGADFKDRGWGKCAKK